MARSGAVAIQKRHRRKELPSWDQLSTNPR
jgi:hypothetical protein